MPAKAAKAFAAAECDLGKRRGAGAMRAGGIAKQYWCRLERGGKCWQRRRRGRQRRCQRGTDGSAATAAGETGPETIVTAVGRRGMACAKGRTKNRTKGRTDRQRGKLARAGNRRADGKQYRLQRDRIGRRQRHERARMVPQVHW